MTKVLITGGAGFIGIAMANELIKRGYEVRVLDLLESPVKEAERIVGSILDISCITRAVRGCDYVIHLAALLGVKRTEERRLCCF